MPKNAHCCVGGCNNDDRYPDRWKVRSNAGSMSFFKFTKHCRKRPIWIENISKGRENFNPGKGTFVCANHFVDGKPTSENPNPTLFLTPRANRYESTPTKRQRLSEIISQGSSPGTSGENIAGAAEEFGELQELEAVEHPPEVESPDYLFEEVVREGMVHFYTGLPNSETFKFLYNQLQSKAVNMNYWKGDAQMQKEKALPNTASKQSNIFKVYEFAGVEPPPTKRGPKRKLVLEDELLLTLMRLRLGLLLKDLAFRFKISGALVSQIFATWIRLMARELNWLIMWPSKGQVRRELPESFRRVYPNVRCIIDCTEVFTETPSALDIQAALWSDYKHHTTIKFLVGITPNGTPSYVSPCYGGRATEKFIVQDCGFLKMLQPFDQVMADRGFKIREELMLYQAYLCIPPSSRVGMQMVSEQVTETSRIGNIRIYVEQAIGRLKRYNIIKHELPVNCLPLCDDIINVVAALTCLHDPLCS